MSNTPLGQNAYNGLAVPTRGESETRQEDSSRTIRTLTHSTANTGRFYTFRDYRLPGSSLANADVAAIDADGGFLALEGTSVKMELNSSGLYAGGAQIIAASGLQAQVALDGATTQHTIVSSNAGKLHVISTQAETSVFIHLPSSGNLAVGMTFDFIFNSTASDLFHFMTTGANAGGEIWAPVDSTNLILTTGAVTHASSGPSLFKFICFSTAGPIWGLQNALAAPTNSTAQLFQLAAGTTA